MENNIAGLKTGDQVLGFFLVKLVECRTAVNNNKYLNFSLADQSGEINAKLWDCTDEDEEKYGIHTLVKVKGTVAEWQKKLQIKIEKIRPVVEEDRVSMADFVPSAPEKPEAMLEEVMDTINRWSNQDLKKIVRHIVAQNKEKILYFPAAQQNHHAVRAGLLYHIVRMLRVGKRLSEIYQVVNQDLLLAGIILHDIAKIEEMETGPTGLVSGYSTEGQLLGHIVQGIKMINYTAGEVGADPETSLILQHMILTHHYEPEFGSPKKPMIPEAELLHFIDMIDSRMYEMEKYLEKVEVGQFSEKIWSLDKRYLYRAGISRDPELP